MSIKAKIIAGTCIITLVTLLLGGSFEYFYFNRILREQSLRDDTIKLNQTARQLTYLSEDIRKFAYSIMIDKDIQDFMRKTYYSDVFEEIGSRDKVIQRLRDFISLREYINSAVIIAPDGNAYWNGASGDYFTKQLQEKWYTEYKKNHQDAGFTGKHEIVFLQSDLSVISFVTPLKNIDEPQKIVGELILNIRMDWIQRYIEPGGTGFDNYLWLGADNEVLYIKDNTAYKAEAEQLFKKYAAEPFREAAVMEGQKGYMVVDGSVGNGWKLAGFTSSQRLYGRIGFVFYFFLVLIFVSIFFITAAVFPLILNTTKPITRLSSAMKKVSQGDLEVSVQIRSGDELEQLGDGFNQMVKDLKGHIEASLKNEKAKRNMEFGLLLSQINPHFIYNTLNSVIYFARKQGNTDIVRLMSSFIKILQDAVKVGEDGTFATLAQEIDIVDHYITIQKFRYLERFEIQWEIDEDLLKLPVPRTLLQPLVENALIHGVLLKEGKGLIRVTVRRHGADMEITVEDDGVGMDRDGLQALLEEGRVSDASGRVRSVGIPNILGRLRFLYGESSGFHAESVPGEGFKVTILLPAEDGHL